MSQGYINCDSISLISCSYANNILQLTISDAVLDAIDKADIAFASFQEGKAYMINGPLETTGSHDARVIVHFPTGTIAVQYRLWRVQEIARGLLTMLKQSVQVSPELPKPLLQMNERGSVKYICPIEGCGKEFVYPGACSTHLSKHVS